MPDRETAQNDNNITRKLVLKIEKGLQADGTVGRWEELMDGEGVNLYMHYRFSTHTSDPISFRE